MNKPKIAELNIIYTHGTLKRQWLKIENNQLQLYNVILNK